MSFELPGFAVVTLIIVVVGLLGGLRNWIREDVPADSRTHGDRHTWIARLIEGVLASAAVPLFLTVIGSEKISPVFKDVDWNDPAYKQAVFILTAFCGIAAIFSNRFLDSLSKKLMHLSEKVEDVEHKVEQSNVLTEFQIEADNSTAENLPESRAASILSENAKVILKALVTGQFLMRSQSGLSESTKLSTSDVAPALRELADLGFVRKLTTDKGPRWAATDQGRIAALGA